MKVKVKARQCLIQIFSNRPIWKWSGHWFQSLGNNFVKNFYNGLISQKRLICVCVIVTHTSKGWWNTYLWMLMLSFGKKFICFLSRLCEKKMFAFLGLLLLAKLNLYHFFIYVLKISQKIENLAYLAVPFRKANKHWLSPIFLGLRSYSLQRCLDICHQILM